MTALVPTSLRTHRPGELTEAHLKQEVRLAGRVDRVERDQGYFMLTAARGEVRVVFPPGAPDEAKAVFATLAPGDVVRVHGVVLPKSERWRFVTTCVTWWTPLNRLESFLFRWRISKPTC